MGLQSKFKDAISGINQVIIGKDKEVELALICLLAGGHLLIEDGPGVGKTTLAQSLARVLGLDFSRIQFTSDLLPQDVLGSMVYNEKELSFKFIKGPIFTQFLLADELNRANPRTQSAFLQAMEESEVTVEGRTYPLSRPFMVIATQNPSEQAGTFPLPESQLDRFLMCLELKPPSSSTEALILRSRDPREKMKDLKIELTQEDITKAHLEVSAIKVSEAVSEYIVSLLNAGRTKGFKLSTRSGMAIAKVAKAVAWLSGLGAVTHDHVQMIAPFVLGHRLGFGQSISLSYLEVSKIVKETKIEI